MTALSREALLQRTRVVSEVFMTQNSRHTLRVFPSIAIEKTAVETPVESSAALSRNRVLDASAFRGARRKSAVKNGANVRRRGQALLISVLLMLFASILGATFVTVVALNLSQTARSSSVGEARDAAQAGLTFVNDQLTNSPDGEHWRPANLAAVPMPSDPNYTYYYSDFERAHGWDTAGYAKFPDPRSVSIPGKSTATYLTKVEQVSGGDRDGQLKVTVIGRANDNDAAYSTLVAYKPTSQNGNFTANSLYVSRWDFDNNKIQDAATNLSNPNYAPTSLLGNLTGIDSVGAGVDAGTVEPRNIAKGGILIQGNATVEGKTTLEVPSSSDLIQVFGNLDVQSAIGDALVRQGAITQNILASNDPATRTGLQLQIHDYSNNDPTSRNTVRAITPARIDAPFSRWRELTKYADVAQGSQYGYGDDPLKGGGIYIDNADDIEKVGKNGNTTIARFRNLTIADTQRLMMRKSFPVDATTGEVGNADVNAGLVNGEYSTGARNVHRLIYARPTPTPPPGPTPLPAYSFPVAPQVDTVANKSYDPSLEERGLRGWINGRNFLPRGAFIELKGNTIVITRDDLSDQSPYRRDSAGNIVYRKDAVGNPILDGNNLPIPEPNPQYEAPDPIKAWKDSSGNPLNNAYRMQIDVTTGTRTVGALNDAGLFTYTPASGKFNGVIFAEGNVRVRGYTDTKDVTIVSMGNIYVEGGINKSSTGNVALLAKRNVVFNPTQITAQLEGAQSSAVVGGNGASYSITTPSTATVSTTQVSSPTSLPVVYKALPLRVGDQFRLRNGDMQWRRVTAIPSISLPYTIAFTPAVAAADIGTTGTVITLSYDTENRQSISQLDNNDKSATIARDIKMDGAALTGNYYLSVNHHGKLRSAFNLFPNVTSPSYVIKQDVGAIGIQDSEKTMTLSPNGALPAYNLLDLDGTTPNVDTYNTLARLRSLFFADTNTSGYYDNPPETRTNNDWLLQNNPAYDSIAARRIASTQQSGAPFDSGIPSRNILLTTSVGIFQLNDLNNLPNSFPTAAAPFKTIGSSFDLAGLSAAYDTTEDTATVLDSFYAQDANNMVEADLRWNSCLLPTLNANISNIVAFRRDQSPGADQLPGYNLDTLRLDRADLATQSADPITITINATIYAQDGSWFVIPTPLENVANVPTLAQQRQIHRQNYQIDVKGSIAQNFIPAVSDTSNETDPDNRSAGAVALWLDSAARPSDTNGTTWQTVRYLASTYAPSTDPTNMLYLPITPDISIQR